MLGDRELAQIRDGLSEADSTVKLTLHPDAESTEFARLLSAFARRIELAGGGMIEFSFGDRPGSSDLLALPCLVLSNHRGVQLRYHALPEGPEIPPFIDTLVALGKTSVSSEDGWSRELDSLERAADVRIFVSMACPNCPRAVMEGNRLAISSHKVVVHIIDAQRFPELAEAHGARSVPLTVIDSRLSLTGVVPVQQLVEHLVARGSTEFAEQELRSLVDVGRFEAAAEAIIGGDAAPLFLSLWRGSTTSTRIGLLLAVEETLDRDPAALDAIVPELALLLTDSEDAALRGDTADLLGQIGHPDAVEPLRGLTDDPNQDVAEIAREALEEIPRDGM